MNLFKFKNQVKIFVATLLSLSAFFVFIPKVQAKDLTGRLGLGFNNEYSNSSWDRPVPALSAKYALSKDLHIQADVGFYTQEPSVITLGGKVYKNIFYETNLNFYGAGAFAYLKNVKSGIEVLGLLGAEFFIPGLESLGILFEAGVSGCNLSGDFHLKTVGFTFLNAGMHFYF